MNRLNSKVLEEIVHKNADNTSRIVEQTHGYVVSEKNGALVATSFDNTTAQAIVKHVNDNFLKLAQSAIRDLDPTDKLCFMRVGTRKFEFLVAPDDPFTITVLL